jgi:N-acyl-D-aspartate/D-glutamate deacylase
VGPDVRGRAGWIVDLIDKAREKGVDVRCDLYGYTAGGAGLVHLTPDFLMEEARKGSLQAATEKAVEDEDTNVRVLKEIKEKFKYFGGPHLFRIRICPSNTNYIGKTLSDVAEEMNQQPEDVILDFLCSGNELSGQWEVMVEKDVIKLMKHPTAMICSDARAMSIPSDTKQETVHPRTFGAFPRVLKWYVSELGVLDLSEAIRKMTSSPAQQIGLINRGLIKEGYHADITVFNPKEVGDRATYTEPYQLPKGIRYVFVNGVLSVKRGKYNKSLAGKVLRKNNI